MAPVDGDAHDPYLVSDEQAAGVSAAHEAVPAEPANSTLADPQLPPPDGHVAGAGLAPHASGGVESMAWVDPNMAALGFASHEAQSIMNDPDWALHDPAMGGGTGMLISQANSAMAQAAHVASGIVGPTAWHQAYAAAAAQVHPNIQDPLATREAQLAQAEQHQAAQEQYQQEIQAQSQAQQAAANAERAIYNAYWS